MTTQQTFKIDLSDYELTRDQRREVADLAIERIYDRSNKGKHLDKNFEHVEPMPKYSAAYEASLDFKIAGKKKGGKPNLQLSGDMLASIRLLKDRRDEITIGFLASDKENNGKAEGNMLGTYGTDTPNAKKARRFLGLTPREIKLIIQEVQNG
jgi:hypothetical protein